MPAPRRFCSDEFDRRDDRLEEVMLEGGQEEVAGNDRDEDVGVEPSRANGMHALRHFYASILIDAGESVRAVADYLGHADPGFTLRVYAHLFPASEDRALQALDSVFRGVRVNERKHDGV